MITKITKTTKHLIERARLFGRAAAIALALGLIGACAATPKDSLYQRIGGAEGVERLVAALLDQIDRDPRIAFLFADSDRDNLQAVIVEQICAESGGPCVYQGLSMPAAHSGLNISHDEFDAFVEDFILAMESQGIATPDQNRLLAIFAPMRSEIVDR